MFEPSLKPPAARTEQKSCTEKPPGQRTDAQSTEWDEVDEASWESFPASDPPAHSVRIAARRVPQQ